MPYSGRNDEMLDMLQGEFQRKYEPNFACENSIPTGLMMTGLRGFWSMGAVDSSGAAIDSSGLGKTLTYNGNPVYGTAGLAPYIAFDGVGDFLSRSDEAGLDILGTESYIALKGLTLGGWFYRSAQNVSQGLIGKWTNLIAQRSYLLTLSASNQAQFMISIDGTATTVVTSTEPIALGTWIFYTGRFTPSSELAIWVNGVKTTNLVGIPASIFNSTTQLNVGAYSNGAQGLFTGRASLVYLCASALSDSVISNYYQQTRALYGV